MRTYVLRSKKPIFQQYLTSQGIIVRYFDFLAKRPQDIRHHQRAGNVALKKKER
ncbi:hypothetical protein QT987_00490 [Microcoleus sp. SVA1B4]